MSEEKEFVLNKLCIEKIKMREREVGSSFGEGSGKSHNHIEICHSFV